MRELHGHARPVDSVVFSPDGQILISGSSYKTVYLWKKYSVSEQLLVLKALYEPELVSEKQRTDLQNILCKLPAETQTLVLQHMPLLDAQYDETDFVKCLPNSICTFKAHDGLERDITVIEQQKMLSKRLTMLTKQIFEDRPEIPFSMQSINDLCAFVHDACLPIAVERQEELLRLLDYLICERDKNDLQKWALDFVKKYQLPRYGILLNSGYRNKAVVNCSDLTRPDDTFELSVDRTYRCIYSPDGKYLLSTHHGSNPLLSDVVCVWDVYQQKKVSEQSWTDFPINEQTLLAWSDNSQSYAVCSGKRCHVVKLAGLTTVFEFQQPVSCLAYYGPDRIAGFSKEAQCLYVCDIGATPILQESAIPLELVAPAGVPAGTDLSATCAELSPDNTMLAVGRAHGVINIINPVTREPIGEPLQRDSASIVALAFDRTGRWLASVSQDGFVRVWRTNTGVLFHTRQLKTGLVTACSISFNSDALLLAVGTEQETVVWQLCDGGKRYDLTGMCSYAFNSEGLFSVLIDSNGHLLQRLNIKQLLTGQQYLLIQKALRAPEQFSVAMLSDEQREQYSDQRITNLANEQKIYLADVRDELPDNLKRLVNERMSWLG